MIDYSEQEGKVIFTKGKNRNDQVEMEKVLYIHSDKNLASIAIKGTEQRLYEVKTVKEYIEELGKYGFYAINRNLVVNTRHITKVETIKRKKSVWLGKKKFLVAKRRIAGLNKLLKGTPV